jgi:hypothetical protein
MVSFITRLIYNKKVKITYLDEFLNVNLGPNLEIVNIRLYL